MSATACCTSKPIIYQIQVITARSQFAPIVPRSTLSPSSSSSPIISISELRTPIKINKAIRSNVNNNNNNNNYHQQISATTHQDASNVSNGNQMVDPIDEERFLAMVGLRSKKKKKSVPVSAVRPLAKRLAAPICLLPLPKYSERVRQALYILLPFLKFLSITHDIELYCSKEDHTKAENLLPRSATQTTRMPKTMQNKINKRKVSKSEFITMATNTFRNNTRRTPMAKYIYSTIQCQVLLDRLDQSTIDQIISNSTADNQTQIASISQKQRSVCHQSTTTTVKHKSSTILPNDSKRLKISHDNDKSISAYKRIYLKCFVCSKRQYIDAEATNSDILHSHWREHGHDLLLNIYDSELDSILTRIVEFFYFPRRHTLEGKIQTVFILNSKEIRKTSSKTVDDNNCIILD